MFEAWAEEFGGDYELHLVGTRAIVVTGLADIRRILALRPSKFKRGLRANLLTWGSQQLGLRDSMFFAEGKAWGRSRRLISPNLSGHNIATMLPLVSKIGERFCAKIGDRADHGKVMKARDSFARFTHDVIAMVAFGLDVGSMAATPESPCHSFDAIEVTTSAFGRLVRRRMDIWAWKFFPMVPWVRKTKEHSRRLHNVIQGAIDGVRLEPKVPAADSEGKVGAGGTLLRKIIGATSGKGSSDRMLFSDQEVMDEATSLFIAGTETTALSLCWAMYYLSKRPEAVLRCRAEALEAAPLSDGMVSTSEQLSKLEFCSAVFKEALRLRTPAPLLMFHSTEDYTMKNGFVVEEGTGVIVLTRAAGVSKEFFTRGKEFVPERWIEAEREEALLGKGEAGDGRTTIAHEAEAFMALGHGPRLCPGQDMAKAEGAIIIAAICARFNISMAPGQADPPEEIASFTNGPKEFDMLFSRNIVRAMESFHDGVGAAAIGTAIAIALAFVWWRRSESIRVQNFVRGSGGQGCSLPSPMPALPRWCGFAGGHTLNMETGKTAAQLEGWAKEFGGDYEIQLVGKRVIVVTGLADIRRILIQRPTKFKRGLGPDQMTWAAEQVGVKHALFFEEGKTWGRSRRLVSPNLNGHNVATMLPVISKIGERLCDKLGDKADAREIVKARDAFARFTHDIIALFALGIDVDSLSATASRPSKSFDAMNYCLTTFEKFQATPQAIWTWKLLPMVPWVRRTKEHLRRGREVIQGAIDAVRRDDAEAPASTAQGCIDTAGGNLLRKIIGATHGKSDRSRFTDEEAMGHASSLFVAGTETSALALTWTMYFLAKHPEALLRCRAEALNAAPLSDGMTSTKDQLSQLEFCSAVCTEALRLRTPAPLLTFYNTEDFTMENGFVVKKGTGILTLNRQLGVQEEFFTRAEDFVPERWISAEREKALLGSRKGIVIHEADAFLGFGLGPMVCPGQAMAKAESAITIAAICARFDVCLAPDQLDPPEEVTAFTSGPTEIDMIFTRRNKEEL
eukprot:g13007.t1